MQKLKVLFLCTGNSCRSQMAEGWAHQLKSDSIDAFSAGVDPHGMNDRAIKVMAEAGVDITRQHSKHVKELRFVVFDYVVTVCDHAHESCPLFPGGAKVVHVGFDDPPRLAREAKDEEEALGHYRRVRDEIRAFIQTLPAGLDKGNSMTQQNPIVDVVREKYGAVAVGDLSSHDASVRAVAQAFGYSADELASIPAEANMGLSCGNPTAFASLRPGEVVVDLGCGGGLDVFLAAQKVGPTGKAIGIDMTPEMIARANQNKGRAGASAANTEFHHGLIDALPLAPQSTDVIISNCVINLAPDKLAVFREMFRVLRPGGRVAVSDIALKRPLPPDLAADLMAYVGCIAGAIMIEDYRRWLTEAGFAHVVVAESGADLNAYANVEGQDACCAPPMSPPRGPNSLIVVAEAPAPATVHGGLTSLLARYNVNDYAASVKVYAVKP